ncbi:hypothetical protein [Hyphomicrobium sp. DY-1]|uniref:hypothetical protein n=1 Tax=Hyphomicrobium sp. DY-1 TaxID=3075650 RepID=UPI0039C4C7AA
MSRHEIIIPPDRQTAMAEPAMAERLAKVEFDRQIATARQFPRSIEKSVAAITTLATLDVETAQDCMYVLPRGGKNISGPSARFAEIIASQWGNNRVAARVVYVDRDEGFIEAEAIFHDLETNSASTSRVRRRILDSKGKVYNEDMIIVTGNAACSIARRNAILGGVPKPAWRRAYDRAQAVIKGDVQSVGTTRDQLVAAFGSLGVGPLAIAAALDLKSVADVKLDDIVTLRGMYATLKSGEASVEEMFGEQSRADRAALAKVNSPDIPDAEEPEKKPEPKQEANVAQASTLLPKTEAPKQSAPSDDDMFPGDRPARTENVHLSPEAFIASLQAECRNCDDMGELEKIRAKHKPMIKKLPSNFAQRATQIIDDAFFAAS